MFKSYQVGSYLLTGFLAFPVADFSPAGSEVSESVALEFFPVLVVPESGVGDTVEAGGGTVDTLVGTVISG